MKDTLLPPTREKTILFDKYEEFVATSSADIPALIDTNNHDDELHMMFQGYEYPICTWPVIIDQKMVDIIKKLSIQIPQLLYQIPELYFNKDVKKIADFYFEGDEMRAQFALMCHEKNVEVGCRLDLTYTEKGFKILEANMGSSIGGWQIQTFEPIIRRLHPLLTQRVGNRKFESRDTQQIYLEFLVDKIIEYVAPQGEVNVFAHIGTAEDTWSVDGSTDFFNQLLERELKRRNLRGVCHAGNLVNLKLEKGKLKYKGDSIHGVIVLNMGDLEAMPPDVFRAFMMDKIYLPDHFGTPMLGDKRNLALLRELAEQGKFTAEENQLILEGIPWTAMLKEGDTVLNGTKQSLIPLLRANKDQFVIKAAAGFQGKDVFIGKFSTAEEWEEALALTRYEHAFIAQAFSDSLDFIAPNIENEWTPHKVVWGSFGFGKKYGGVWTRISAVKTDVGIINCARGAVEAVVYEEIFDKKMVI